MADKKVLGSEKKNDKNRPSEKAETALIQIEKDFGKGAVMKLGQNAAMNVEAISTGSLSLDLAPE